MTVTRSSSLGALWVIFVMATGIVGCGDAEPSAAATDVYLSEAARIYESINPDADGGRSMSDGLDRLATLNSDGAYPEAREAVASLVQGIRTLHETDMAATIAGPPASAMAFWDGVHETYAKVIAARDRLKRQHGYTNGWLDATCRDLGKQRHEYYEGDGWFNRRNYEEAIERASTEAADETAPDLSTSRADSPFRQPNALIKRPWETDAQYAARRSRTFMLLRKRDWNRELLQHTAEASAGAETAKPTTPKPEIPNPVKPTQSDHRAAVRHFGNQAGLDVIQQTADDSENRIVDVGNWTYDPNQDRYEIEVGLSFTRRIGAGRTLSYQATGRVTIDRDGRNGRFARRRANEHYILIEELSGPQGLHVADIDPPN